MKIIGHRGAAGLALENTLASFKMAKKIGVDAVELDVRKTADDVLVIFHDENLLRLANQDREISTLTWQSLKNIPLSDNKSTIPRLIDALKLLTAMPILIELKEEGCVDLLVDVLSQFPSLDCTIVSFKLTELLSLRSVLPNIKIYANEHTKPVEIIQLAKAHKYNGIGLKYFETQCQLLHGSRN